MVSLRVFSCQRTGPKEGVNFLIRLASGTRGCEAIRSPGPVNCPKKGLISTVGGLGYSGGSPRLSLRFLFANQGTCATLLSGHDAQGAVSPNNAKSSRSLYYFAAMHTAGLFR